MKVCNVIPGFIEQTAFGEHYFDSNPSAKVDIYGQFTGLLPDQVAEVIG